MKKQKTTTKNPTKAQNMKLFLVSSDNPAAAGNNLDSAYVFSGESAAAALAQYREENFDYSELFVMELDPKKVTKFVQKAIYVEA